AEGTIAYRTCTKPNRKTRSLGIYRSAAQNSIVVPNSFFAKLRMTGFDFFTRKPYRFQEFFTQKPYRFMPVSPDALSDFFENTPPVLVQKLESEVLREKQIELYVRREDLLHPEVSGNKWRKLKYNLLAAAEQHCDTLLTFGGAFSNHIAAVAAA